MIAQQFTQQQLIAMLAWQVEMGADEAVLDKPSHDLQAPQSSDDISGSTPTPVSVASLTASHHLRQLVLRHRLARHRPPLHQIKQCRYICII